MWHCPRWDGVRQRAAACAGLDHVAVAQTAKLMLHSRLRPRYARRVAAAALVPPAVPLLAAPPLAAGAGAERVSQWYGLTGRAAGQRHAASPGRRGLSTQWTVDTLLPGRCQAAKQPSVASYMPPTRPCAHMGAKPTWSPTPSTWPGALLG